MARPITALRSRHESREAQWGAPVAIHADQRAKLEGLLSRELSPDEAAELTQLLNRVRVLYKKPAPTRNRTVRQHLNAIAKCTAEIAPGLYENADTITRALIFDQLHAAGKLQAPSPDEIRAAAQHALANFNNLPAGRPLSGWQRIAVEAAVRKWRDYGMTDMRVWCGGDEKQHYASPLIRWTAQLMSIATGRPADHSTTRSLLLEELKHI